MDPLSLWTSVWDSFDRIVKLISLRTELFQAQSELCDYRADLQKLRPALLSLPVKQAEEQSEDFSDVVIILRNSESTAQLLYNRLPGTWHDGHEQGDFEEFLPSIRLMSAAVNQLRWKLLKKRIQRCSTPLSAPPDMKTVLQGSQSNKPCDSESFTITKGVDHEIEHDWVVPTLEGCSPDTFELAPVEKSIGEHADTWSTLSHVARVLQKITVYWKSDQRKRKLHSEVELVRCETPQEYIDCAAWFLEQSQTTSAKSYHKICLRPRIQPCSLRRQTTAVEEISQVHKKPFSWKNIFPEHRGQKYFSIRAACCVRASLRPLTARELFFATTTTVSPYDHQWPFAIDDEESSVAELMHICEKFLGINDRGFVKFRDDYKDAFLGDDGLVSDKDAHLFMSLVCLSQLKRYPRLILKPWLDYHRLETEEQDFPLHKYVVIFWPSHCREVEAISTRIPSELDVVIQAAWISERGARSLDVTEKAASDTDTLLLLREALDIGLEVSLAHGFGEMERSYRKMGAKPADEDALDMREWEFVEPFQTSELEHDEELVVSSPAALAGVCRKTP